MSGIDAPTDRAFDRSPHVTPARYLTDDIAPVGGTLNA